MASEKLFRDIPPFPDDLPTVSLNTISLSGLHSNDTAVVQQTLDACQELGFFFLDMRGDKIGDEMIKCIDELFSIGKNIFDLPESVKSQYLHDMPNNFLGSVTSQLICLVNKY